MKGGRIMKTSYYVEFGGKKVAEADIVKKAKKTFTSMGYKVVDIKSMQLYVKVEENAVYYVFNDTIQGHFILD